MFIKPILRLQSALNVTSKSSKYLFMTIYQLFLQLQCYFIFKSGSLPSSDTTILTFFKSMITQKFQRIKTRDKKWSIED